MKRKRLLLIFLIVFHAYNSYSYDTNSVITTAIKEIGNGEQNANNAGSNVKRYTQGKEVPWCAGFVSYCLKQANINTISYSLSAKKIWNEAKQLNITTKIPKAGDLIVFWREQPNSWKGHIGIIEVVNDKTIIAIEGNVGKYPAKVKRVTYQINNIPRLLGFIRVNK